MRSLCFIILIAFGGCVTSHDRKGSEELIAGTERQDSLFAQLMRLTETSMPERIQPDSIAILILPLEASCPSCRKKTIDSIVNRQHDLRNGHYVVLSGTTGRRTMNAYFMEEGASIPTKNGRLLLDTTARAIDLGLVEDRPTIYYAARKKVYKKVGVLPESVRKDLREFFSGFRELKESE